MIRKTKIMDENEMRRISNGLKHGPGYVFKGKLAKLKMVPVEVSNGRAAVYLVVWHKRGGEPIFFNLLPAGKWNEGLMDELLKRLKQAVGANSEQTLQRRLSEVSEFIISLTSEQNAKSN